MSAAASNARRSRTRVAPAETNASSVKPLPAPAPGSISTVAPSAASRATFAGIIAERVSTGAVSLGTPIIIWVVQDWETRGKPQAPNTKLQRNSKVQKKFQVPSFKNAPGQAGEGFE